MSYFKHNPLQIAVYGKNFNRSARDAWELFQSTGVEALIAYDCSGAVILMGTLVGGLVAGTCAGIWTRIKHPDRVMMVGSTSLLMGMILVSYSYQILAPILLLLSESVCPFCLPSFPFLSLPDIRAQIHSIFSFHLLSVHEVCL